MKLLSIQIPTILGREKAFNELYAFLMHQITRDRLKDVIEVIACKDNKELSIGSKRQRLYEMADAKYSVQIDDDDWLHNEYCKKVIKAMETTPDCITYKEHCTIDGRIEFSNFSLNYSDWASFKVGRIKHARTPFFKTPIKTDLCLRTGVNDMRFGEDHDFAKRIKPILKTEIHIDEFMYLYRHNSTPFKERYGIK